MREVGGNAGGGDATGPGGDRPTGGHGPRYRVEWRALMVPKARMKRWGGGPLGQGGGIAGAGTDVGILSFLRSASSRKDVRNRKPPRRTTLEDTRCRPRTLGWTWGRRPPGQGKLRTCCRMDRRGRGPSAWGGGRSGGGEAGPAASEGFGGLDSRHGGERREHSRPRWTPSRRSRRPGGRHRWSYRRGRRARGSRVAGGPVCGFGFGGWAPVGGARPGPVAARRTAAANPRNSARRGTPREWKSWYKRVGGWRRPVGETWGSGDPCGRGTAGNPHRRMTWWLI